MHHTLLVPLDGSQLGEAALPWVACLARARGLALVLAQAIPLPQTATNSVVGGYLTPETYDQILRGEREAATAYLEGVRRRVAGWGMDAEIAVREGEPAEALLDLADELGAYAIAMTTHGRGGLRRLVLGSVAERVLHRATIPLLLVRADSARPGREPSLERLLVPLDGSPLAERAIDIAQEIAPRGATLVLVRVQAPIRRTVGGSEGTVTIEDAEATRRATADAEQYLGRVGQNLDKVRWSIRTSVRVGAEDGAADEILAAARREAVDLVVMSTHGHTGPARWFLGSVADQVARRSEWPVLLVNARALAARVTGSCQVGDLMTDDLATVRDDEPLIVALRKLLRRRISGAPVVNADGDLVGVISEHDLLQWQARLIETLEKEAAVAPEEYARRLETELVRQVMAHPATTIDESTSLSAAIDLFRKRQLRRLPVTRGGRLVGILGRADVLMLMAAQWQASSERDSRAGATERGTEESGA